MRHAAVVPAWAGRWIGSGSDPDCDPAALRALGPELARLAARDPPVRVIASPSRRARQTAALLGRPVEVDQRLAERRFGDWEGRRVDECLAGVDPSWLESAERYLEMPIAGAEAPAAVAGRALALWRELAAAPEACVWCVGHGGSLRALWAAATGETLARAFAQPLLPGGVIRLTARTCALDPTRPGSRDPPRDRAPGPCRRR